MKSFSLLELANLLNVELIGDPNHLIHGINALDEATQDELSFLANDRYTESMKKSKAGAICVAYTTSLTEGKNYLLCTNPSATFQRVAEKMFSPSHGSSFKQIHTTAVIHESVKIGPNVTIGPFVSIDQGCSIAEGTTISSHVSIGYDVEVGKDCFIHPNCTLRERVRLGNRVILQPGAVIGSCGFGYIQDSLGHHVKIEQLGIVILEDDVEIGANTTIDRSRFKATIICKGTKIDNLCQIAHNVEIGDHTIIAAQTGIAGSTKIGKHVILGGQVGIAGHVQLGDWVMVASQGGVSKSLNAGKYRGTPAIPIAKYSRQEVYVRKLEEYVARLKRIEEKLEALV